MYVRNLRIALRRTDPLDIFEEDYSAGYKTTMRATLRLWAEYTEDEELAAAIAEPRIGRKITSAKSGGAARGPLSESDYRRLWAAVQSLRGREPYWAWAGLSLACKLALRIGSDLVTGVRRESVQLALGRTRLQIWGKGDKVRELPAAWVQVELSHLLRYDDWERLEDLVAPDVEGEWRYHAAYKVYRRIIHILARSAGLVPTEINTHRIRKSSAYMLYKKLDHDIDAVRRILGHEDASTTQAYLGIDNLDEIGEAMKDIFDRMDEEVDDDEEI